MLIAVAAVPLFRFRLPSTFDGLRRLDRGSGLTHRPATALADELAAGEQDQVSLALWRAHVEQALRAANALKAGTPRPRLPLFDPIAVRALVVLLVVATFFAASRRARQAHHGGVRLGRRGAGEEFPRRCLGDAADLHRQAAGDPARHPRRRAASGRADPDGAGRQRAGDPRERREPARSADQRRTWPRRAAKARRRRRPEPTSTAYVITDRGTATLRGVLDDDVTFTFAAIPDRAPTIALTKDPEPQARGSLQLAYKIEDDYGVIGAQANFALKQKAGPDGRVPRPLYGAPDFPLVLPQARTRNGAGPDHQGSVRSSLGRRRGHADADGARRSRQRRSSTPTEFKLPERVFVKPLARALIEQRRNLALDAEAKPRLLAALDALSIAPERFTPELSHYLGLRSIYWQLTHAKTDDQLRDVVARLWGMAVTIEDGQLSDAEAALRAAQEALRQALERGATDEEIKKLIERAARRARQVHAGAGRADAQEPAAARAAARPEYPHAAAAGSQEHDRPDGAARALGRQGCGASSCSKSCSRCWRTCRWRGPASRAATTWTTT